MAWPRGWAVECVAHRQRCWRWCRCRVLLPLQSKGRHSAALSLLHTLSQSPQQLPTPPKASMPPHQARHLLPALLAWAVVCLSHWGGGGMAHIFVLCAPAACEGQSWQIASSEDGDGGSALPACLVSLPACPPCPPPPPPRPAPHHTTPHRRARPKSCGASQGCGPRCATSASCSPPRWTSSPRTQSGAGWAAIACKHHGRARVRLWGCCCCPVCPPPVHHDGAPATHWTCGPPCGPSAV